MAPFADMINHKLENNIRWFWDSTRQSFKFEATENIAFGEAMFTSYGHKPSNSMFLNYGFVVDEGME